jgi:DNA-binding response OmpR family regulator
MDTHQDTVLIADDNPGVRRVLSRCLEKGRRVLTAVDGDSALTMAREHLPDLIILDVRMPGRDGNQVCAELRGCEATRGIPILMLTGLDEHEAAFRAIGSPADAWLAKPFNLHVLEDRVRALLGRGAAGSARSSSPTTRRPSGASWRARSRGRTRCSARRTGSRRWPWPRSGSRT